MKLENLRNFDFSTVGTAEMSSPTLLLLWATWFALFDAIGSSPSYAASFLANFQWAIVFAAVGVFKAFSVMHGNLTLRRIGAITSIVLWLMMFAIFAVSNFQSHAVPTCLFFAYVNVLTLDKLFRAN